MDNPDDFQVGYQPPADERRFKIYFRTNNYQPGEVIDGLTVQEYLKLYHNDEYTIQYCKKIFCQNGKTLNRLFRSIDDVHYEHKKGRHESPIWKHVTKIGDKIKCNYCQKDYKDFKNTTNMLRHLKTQHPLFFEQEKQPIAPTKRRRSKSLETPKIYFIHKLFKLAKISASSCNDTESVDTVFKKMQSFKNGAQCDKINNAILFFISRDIQPISVVENEGFTTLIKILSPLYKVPSAKTVTKQLEARYEVMKINFIDEIKSSLYYCFTCDVWTDISNTSYMGITIHYTTADVEFKSGNLGCIPLSDRHTAENLAEQFKTVLKDFQISLMNEKYVAHAFDWKFPQLSDGEF
ncbi:hypothetical protein TKK_0017837 [Trichogramma kaykai]